MSDRERAKEWLDEMSSNDIDRILYFMNLSLTKRDLYYEKCELKKEIERLNNIISEALGIANERINYYYHNKNDELLKEWEEIFEELIKRDNELKGDNK